MDTDGYDFDVLKSSENILIKSEPILFWENQMFEDFQIQGFNDLYKLLQKSDINIFMFLITSET